jgi:transcriptional regulator with XRE-family HTH domain
MNYLIKQIRADLGINQEQLAKLLGTSPITVNRWENSKTQPTQMAQKQIYELCKKHKIDLADYITESVQAEPSVEGILLYHGSRNGLTGAIAPCSRSRCDFGKGFYMGTDPLQPLTLICNEDKPVFYTLQMKMDGLKCLHVDIGIDWAMLIAYFRGYMDGEENCALYEKYANMADGYDVIEGYIANDRMYQVLTDFFERRITDAALIGSLSALKLGKQYVAVTQKACDQIRVLKEKKLSKLELMILKDRSIVRRNEGISLAEQIVTAHRRDGRYFDEILKGVEI